MCGRREIVEMNRKELTDKISQAISESPEKKFTASVELVLNFRDVRMEGEHKLNVNVLLPKGRGKKPAFGVFAEGEMNAQAKKLVDVVLNKSEVEATAKNRRKMRVIATKCYGFITQPDMMPLIGKTWGVVLAPRGKMPQPIPPNADLAGALARMQNTVRIRSKKNPTVQVPVGTQDMQPDDLAENVLAVYNSVERVIPEDQIRSVFVKTTMGKPMKVK